jgi:hypothetical protein
LIGYFSYSINVGIPEIVFITKFRELVKRIG